MFRNKHFHSAPINVLQQTTSTSLQGILQNNELKVAFAENSRTNNIHVSSWIIVEQRMTNRFHENNSICFPEQIISNRLKEIQHTARFCNRRIGAVGTTDTYLGDPGFKYEPSDWLP